MAELDPIIQEVLLEGDSDITRALQEVGEKGAEAFKSLAEAAEGGAASMEHFGTAITAITGAISAAVVGVIAFAEAQDEAVQKTAFLAEALGTTADVVNGITDSFAAAGVSASNTERLLQRLTTTIAQQWPSIAASIRTATTQSEASQEQLVAASLRVQQANEAIATGAEEDSNRIEAANQKVASAYLTISESAQKAASEENRANLSVEASQNSVEAAQQRLNTLLGNPPTAEQKQQLEISQAQVALDQARQASVDALNAKQHQAEQQAITDKKNALELATAQLAADKAEQAATDNLISRQNALAEARTHQAEVQEKAQQQQLSSIPAISTALGGIVDKNKDVATSIDLTQVSTQNLTKGILALAASTNKVEKPTGLQAFKELTEVLANDTDHLISQDQRLNIVQGLVSRGMGQAGLAVSDLLKALERGPEGYEKYIAAAQKHISVQEDGIKAAEEFKRALEDFNQQLELTFRDLAVLASPALVEFFKALKDSITSTDGALHAFVDGIKAIGGAIADVIRAIGDIGTAIDKAFNLAPGRSLQVLIIALIGLVGTFASAWIAIPAAIASVVTILGYVTDHMKEINEWLEKNRLAALAIGAAIGVALLALAPWATILGAIVAAVVLIATNWDKVKQAASDAWTSTKQVASDAWSAIEKAGDDAWNAIKEGALSASKVITDFLQGILDKLSAIKQAAPSWLGGGGGVPSNTDAATLAAGNANTGITGLAGGGEVHGPGTTTSDSILARLSRGEFVVKAQAVETYGAGLFHALNSMTFPGFAAGGLVPSPVRMASGGGTSQHATSTLNLSIGGRSFNGLSGPKSVIDDLTSFAISRQTSATGKNPGWMK